LLTLKTTLATSSTAKNHPIVIFFMLVPRGSHQT